MTSYNATIELDLSAGELTTDAGDDLIERFVDWHPAIGVSMLGRVELTVTLPAETLQQAAQTVASLTRPLPVVRTTVETTADFDRRNNAEVPALVSVTEAAILLGVTRAAVQKRIASGALPAVRVGSIWAVPAASI
jgi:excisionase family DNA binding protein